jgi:hypothetical protein
MIRHLLFLLLFLPGLALSQSNYNGNKVEKMVQDRLNAYRNAATDQDKKIAFRKLSGIVDELLVSYPSNTNDIIRETMRQIKAKEYDFDFLYFKGQFSLIQTPELEEDDLTGGNALMLASEMPVFPTCQEETNPFKRMSCTEAAMAEFFQKNMQYLEVPENTVLVVEFIINRKGKVTDAKVTASVNPEIDAEALRVANLLNAVPGGLTPAINRGEAVNLRYTLPVKF